MEEAAAAAAAFEAVFAALTSGSTTDEVQILVSRAKELNDKVSALSLSSFELQRAEERADTLNVWERLYAPKRDVCYICGADNGPTDAAEGPSLRVGFDCFMCGGN